MEFRPCIDIHNGKVKQIVGSSLADKNDAAEENFVAEKGAAYYAKLYQEKGLKGGHIILLNAASSAYYDATKSQALAALAAYPGGFQIGGGICAENAEMYLEAGASHVIVTSYVFQDGHIHWKNLEKIVRSVGKEHLVLDLSCRMRNGAYYIVTDRWQKFTDEVVNDSTLDTLIGYCDEFLIHAVDVEGKARGIEKQLAALLGAWGKIPITYAGGIGCYEDLDELRKLGKDRLDFTIGSALDLFGGDMEFEKICRNFTTHVTD